MINNFMSFVLIKYEKSTEKPSAISPFRLNLTNYSSLFFSGRIPPGENLIITSIIPPINTNLR